MAYTANTSKNILTVDSAEYERAIRDDDPAELRRLFPPSNDAASAIVRDLAALCISAGARSCLAVVMSRRTTEADRAWILERAESATRRTGCLSWLDMLPDKGETEGVRFYALVLAEARSPDAVAQAAARLPLNFDYWPFVMHHCANPNSHPGVIDALAERMPRAALNRSYWKHDDEDDDDDDDDDEHRMTPLSVAAGALHIAAIGVLLRRGADPMPLPLGSGDGEIPLWSVLRRSFPDIDDVGGLIDDRDARQWRREIAATASRMHTATAMLLGAAEDNTHTARRGGGGGGGDHLHVGMLAASALAFVETLRGLLRKQIRYLTDDATRNALLTPCEIDSEKWALIGRVDTADVGSDDVCWEEEGEETEEEWYRWRRDLTAAELRAALRRWDIELVDDLVELWELLLTPQLIATLEKHAYLRMLSISRGASNGSSGVITTTTIWTAQDCLYDFIISADADDAVCELAGRMFRSILPTLF